MDLCRPCNWIMLVLTFMTENSQRVMWTTKGITTTHAWTAYIRPLTPSRDGVTSAEPGEHSVDLPFESQEEVRELLLLGWLFNH